MPVRPFIQLWIWVSAFATLAGWTLSAFGQLNRAGYAVAFVAFLIFLFLARKSPGLARIKNPGTKKFFRRFRRPLPFCFAALAVLIFLGGSLYPPNNYTALTYRVPRALQWLAHDHWFWIHTTNYRMNDRACGIEWLSAPLLLFTHSTRPLFLLNFLPFLLMPGLTFSVCTRLGVRPRVAWQWMWLLPTGYNFLLQAGSSTNDTFPTIYALAAIDYALRARQSENPSDTANSILSAALLIGAKASNLPLLLPWAILMAANGWLGLTQCGLLRRIVRQLSVVIIAAIVSFLPTAILNSIYCGDWSGAVLEPPIMTVKNPLIAFTGNSFQLLLGNACPPFFPPAAWWNAHATEIVPRALVSVSTHFDTGFFQLGELPTEDWAGIGLCLSVLLVLTVLAKFFGGQTPGQARGLMEGEKLRRVMLLAPWIALLAYCVKSGMTGPARLIAPYYPLLLPLLLTGAGPAQLIRRCSWRVLVFVNLAVAFAILILSPMRPLWPAQTILSHLAARHPDSHLLVRAQKVYSLFSTRFDSLAVVRNSLPENLPVVGFAGGPDDAEISLWLPLGSRRVEDFLVSDSPADLRKQGIEYAVVSDLQLQQDGITIGDWLQKSGAELLSVTHVTLKITTGEQTFYIVRFRFLAERRFSLAKL
jgi:hypothetical protein